jgi:uncharacterized protein (TIGR03083 family)
MDELLNTLDDDPDAARELSALQDVVAALEEQHAISPPPGLRHSVLDAVSEIEPATLVAPTSPPEVYMGMVELMATRLSQLAPDQWATTAHPYDWSVQALIAHLTSIERYTAAKLGIASFDYPEESETDHLGLGEHVIAEESAHSPVETMRAWRDAADVVVGHVTSMSDDELRAGVGFHGFPVRVSTLLVLRSFEIWTHSDDVARANGLPPTDPRPGELRTMSMVSVRLAQQLLADGGTASGGLDLRLVLTGDGGGVFPVQLGDSPGSPAATVIADVVDYCRMASQRIAPDELRASITGDTELARAFLGAAASFAV